MITHTCGWSLWVSLPLSVKMFISLHFFLSVGILFFLPTCSLSLSLSIDHHRTYKTYKAYKTYKDPHEWGKRNPSLTRKSRLIDGRKRESMVCMVSMVSERCYASST